MTAEETSAATRPGGAAGTAMVQGERPKTGAAPFAPGEIFFSRTDGRGVIAAFNDVFVAIAQLDQQLQLVCLDEEFSDFSAIESYF